MRAGKHPADPALPAVPVNITQGKAPLRIKVTGPEPLILKVMECGAQQNRWGGKGYLLKWGDGASVNYTEPLSSPCDELLEHTYEKPGTYELGAKIYHLGPTDGPVTDWEGATKIVVQP